MFTEPKDKSLCKLVQVCGLLRVKANYITSDLYVPEAAQMPRAIKEFYDPHGDEVSEEQLKEAVQNHLKQHGWRLNPVWVEVVYRDFNKPYGPQMEALKAKVAEVTSSDDKK